jgi:acetyl-CoA synthetase
VAARLQDAEASVVVTADGFWRRGQRVEMKAVADEAVAARSVGAHVIVVSRLGTAAVTQPRDRVWSDLVDSQSDTAETAHRRGRPVMLIYTSGTTGRRRARCTRTAAFRSRRLRTWRTPSTSARATPCTG